MRCLVTAPVTPDNRNYLPRNFNKRRFLIEIRHMRKLKSLTFYSAPAMQRGYDRGCLFVNPPPQKNNNKQTCIKMHRMIKYKKQDALKMMCFIQTVQTPVAISQ